MTWTVSCYCGHTFHCLPPAECPHCGIVVTDGRNPASDSTWLAMIRDELGTAGTTSYDQPNDRW